MLSYKSYLIENFIYLFIIKINTQGLSSFYFKSNIEIPLLMSSINSSSLIAFSLRLPSPPSCRVLRESEARHQSMGAMRQRSVRAFGRDEEIIAVLGALLLLVRLLVSGCVERMYFLSLAEKTICPLEDCKVRWSYP